MYKDVVSAVIKQHGVKCKIKPMHTDKVFYAYGIVEPLCYSNRNLLREISMSDGFIDKGYYLFIGAPEYGTELFVYGTEIEYLKQQYVMIHAEQYYIGSEVVCNRAILRKASDNEQLHISDNSGT